MSDISGGANIQGIKTWIANGFSIDGLSSIIDGSTEVFRVTAIHKAHSDSEFGKSIVEEIIRSTIQTGRRDDFIACSGDIQNRKRFSSLP